MRLIRLTEILKEKDLASKDLASEMGISPVTVSRIANGKTFPSPDMLVNLSEALDVDIKDLFYSTKEKEPLYVMRDGKYVAIGEMNLEHLKGWK